MRIVFLILLMSVLISTPIFGSEALERLMSAKSLKCEYGSGAVGVWEGSKVKVVKDNSHSSVVFDSIDLNTGKARMIGEIGVADVDVDVFATGSGLTFIEQTSSGNLHITTVFAYYVEGTTDFTAVTSRHLLFPIIPLPSQFHGICKVETHPLDSNASATNLRSSYRELSVAQVQSMPNMFIRSKEYSGFRGHSTINHSYSTKSISGDKVVIDNATGLMWHQNGSDEMIFWDKAKEWVRSLNDRGYAGYSDWRFPTVEEAASLLESSKQHGQYVDSVFSRKQWGTWTGDSKNSSETAWCVNFCSFFGNVYGIVHWDTIYRFYCVRPVRSVK